MAEEEAWTVGRLLTWTTDYLRQHDSDSPRLDAEVLLAEARGCQRIELYTSFNEVVDEEQRAVFRDFVRRRAAGEPVAYLVNHREFYSLSFKVTPDVLIPRPETELLVVHTLDILRGFPTQEEPFVVVDAGTGSGAIAITLATQEANCRLIATDISPAALQIAAENSERHGVTERVQLLEGDLLLPVPGDLRLDVVVSNPPYVSQAEWRELPVQVKNYEPYEALVGGAKGVEIIARLVKQAADRLRPGGWLLCEISPMIEAAARQCFEDAGVFSDIQLVKDLAAFARVIKARRQ